MLCCVTYFFGFFWSCEVKFFIFGVLYCTVFLWDFRFVCLLDL